MATGEKFTEKSLLLKALGDLVFFNRKNQTKSDNIQKGLKHLAETFWGPEDGKQYARKDGDWVEVESSNSGICTVDDFSDQVGSARIELRRTVCGDDVTIVGQITQNSDGGTSDYPSIEVIPAGFKFRKWFRVSEIVTINEKQVSWSSNSAGNQVAGLGYLYINQLSTSIDDPSHLSLDATDVGVQRYYSAFDANGSNVDGEGFMSYNPNSPCNLVASGGFTVGYKNQEVMSRGYTADSIVVAFSIKGTLYGNEI